MNYTGLIRRPTSLEEIAERTKNVSTEEGRQIGLSSLDFMLTHKDKFDT